MHEILITGFPYVRERYFATFRRWPESSVLSFLLPRVWTAKGGKVLFHPPTDENITTASTYFHHSHYPIIGGLLKGFMPGFFPYLWKYRLQIKLVYSCSEPILLTTLFQALWSKILGKRHVCFTWENIPYQQKFRRASRLIHLVILRMTLALSDGLICGNRAGAPIHRRYTKKPIEVIPMNGLDPELFRRADVPRPAHLSDAILYTFIGAIGYRKGIQIALEALSEVLKSIPNAHLIIAGSGEYEHQIDTLIHTLGVRDHVTRVPWVDHQELIRLLSISDIFLYPSIPYGGWAEQFGYSMAEASLMELPVISTNSGSIPDVVVHDATGILVEPGNVHQLAEAMIRLGKDGELRMRLGRAGRAYIEKNFSHTMIAQHFFGFFRLIFDSELSR